jgi:hypothetical protein
MGLTGGSGLTPYAKKSVLSTNYIDFTSAEKILLLLDTEIQMVTLWVPL